MKVYGITERCVVNPTEIGDLLAYGTSKCAEFVLKKDREGRWGGGGGGERFRSGYPWDQTSIPPIYHY